MKCIDKVKRCLTGLFLATGLWFTVCGNAAAGSQESGATTDGTHFRVSYKSKVEPLPLNRIHSWVLHVETFDGKPVKNAGISVNGGMPAHTHGLPTQPEVTETGNGDYLVEGLKFSMTGVWEMRFTIRAGGVTDHIQFGIIF